MQAADPDEEASWVWNEIKAESEPALASYFYSTILSHSTLDRSLAFHLGNKLCSSTLLSNLLCDLFLNTFSVDPELRSAAVADLCAARSRDPACVSFSHCFLNYTGFLACQVMGNGVWWWWWWEVALREGGGGGEKREKVGI
ncbi:putative serine O-acetyltransferase [Helianthus anomalus]